MEPVEADPQMRGERSQIHRFWWFSQTGIVEYVEISGVDEFLDGEVLQSCGLQGW